MNYKRIALILCFSLLIVACGGGGGSSANSSLPAPPPPPVGSLGDGQLVDLVEWARASQDLPAMGAVVVLNGQVAEMAVSGLRTLSQNESVSAADAWHIGSLTKALTSTLIAALVEQSVLSWNTTPLEVWPELDATMHPQFRSITIKQLLSHTAGIQSVNAAPSQYGDAAFGTLVEKRRSFSAELLSSAPESQVGVQHYTNGGYIIAGAMAETLMSAPWEDLLRDYVFAPLDMRETGFGAPGGPGAATQPWGHWDQGNRFDPVVPGPDADNPQVFGPAGTIHTTLNDYAKFMIAHINGARGIDGFLTAATFTVLHTPLDSGLALGWGVQDSGSFPGFVELAHGGSNLRWYAIVTLVPGTNGGALFVVNAGGERSRTAIDTLDDLVVERFKNAQ